MKTILVVDDARDYCEEISAAFRRDGFLVSSANTVDDALYIGSLLRPDVAIIDWMLKDQIDGLQVARWLTCVQPSTRPILVTGFGSHDVRADVAEDHFCDLLEKPFPLETLREAVRSTLENSKRPAVSLPVGFLEVDFDNIVLYASDTAQNLLRLPVIDDTESAIYFNELWQKNQDLNISGKADWVCLRTQNGTNVLVRVRTIEPLRTHLVLVVPITEQQHVDHPLVQRLLSASMQGIHPLHPNHNAVLFIDPNSSIRRSTAAMLRRVGCICYGAETVEEAVKIFDRDKDVRVIVIDDETVTQSPLILNHILQSGRTVTVIGSGGKNAQKKLSECGITNFIIKPWQEAELIAALQSSGLFEYCSR